MAFVSVKRAYIMNDKKIIIGRIASPHGLHGWIKINSYTTPKDSITQYQTIYIEHQKKWITYTDHDYKLIGKTPCLKLPSINTPETARHYTNNNIAIHQDQLPSLNNDEFYWNDLIDLTVKLTNGTTLGTITRIIETGSNDVFVVKDKDNQQHLIPYISHVVISINLDQGVMIVDWEPMEP